MKGAEVIFGFRRDDAEKSDVAEFAENFPERASRTQAFEGIFDFTDIRTFPQARVYRYYETLRMVGADMFEILVAVQTRYGRTRPTVYIRVEFIFFYQDVSDARAETVSAHFGRAYTDYYRFRDCDSHNRDDCRFVFFYSD